MLAPLFWQQSSRADRCFAPPKTLYVSCAQRLATTDENQKTITSKIHPGENAFGANEKRARDWQAQELSVLSSKPCFASATSGGQICEITCIANIAHMERDADEQENSVGPKLAVHDQVPVHALDASSQAVARKGYACPHSACSKAKSRIQVRPETHHQGIFKLCRSPAGSTCPAEEGIFHSAKAYDKHFYNMLPQVDQFCICITTSFKARLRSGRPPEDDQFCQIAAMLALVARVLQP
jgi:hypothetical protein